ncbi:MAG TPA: outer membrane beta-barrel protein [Candidatus Binataceae bacterium]|nr:outer membrane beta-barrel protein [Candidatus Binataceae bacterium]
MALLIASAGWAQTTTSGAPAASPPAAPAAVVPAAAGSPAAPAAAATPTPPLSSPSMTGPLQMASPNVIDLSKLPLLANIPGIADFGKIDVNGVASGIGIVQNHAALIDKTARADISNAQIILQKPDGVVQFYLQVGAYDSPALGTPYVSAGKAVDDLYGPMPVAYLKIAPNDNFSIMAGNLPTLIGAEYTFTFENLNVERGLLWNQENAINRGVQLNYNQGPVSASLSWSNGFYSDSYTWLIGSLAYAFNSANTLSFVGGGNLGTTKQNSFVAPVLLNNSQIYNLIYTYSSAPWIIQPYAQWTYVPKNTAIGALQATSTIGGALLASYAVTDNFFLAGRAEYIGSTGNTTNLLYGPGSEAWSLTFTPTYQYKQFFVRPEVSYVQAMGYTSGDVFGGQGRNPAQVRGLLEIGLLL